MFRALNAADYGVPQRRERVLIVAFRSDLGVRWAFPQPTHSLDALLWDQWVTGKYWERHEINAGQRPPIADRFKQRVGRLRQSLFCPSESPWATVRDAISDLPNPEKGGCSIPPNHRFMPGARSYLGHTGSLSDEPAKTLKAGDHGVPGGENTLAHGDGRIRYFTVRESARIQTFPDEYAFHGSWSESMRQLGNAVPVKLGQRVAADIKTHLVEAGNG
ncbi:MAG: DNA cytosine methyltransferase [Dehalococcoidia bacterium]